VAAARPARLDAARDLVASFPSARSVITRRLERLVLSRTVKPVIEHGFPLERASEAYALSEGGRARGKILIRIG